MYPVQNDLLSYCRLHASLNIAIAFLHNATVLMFTNIIIFTWLEILGLKSTKVII